jgi:hypothetical protein
MGGFLIGPRARRLVATASMLPLLAVGRAFVATSRRRSCNLGVRCHDPGHVRGGDLTPRVPI